MFDFPTQTVTGGVVLTLAHTRTPCGQATRTLLYLYDDGSVSLTIHAGFCDAVHCRWQVTQTHGAVRRVWRTRLARAVKYGW